MKEYGIFDVVGPNMIGPSSSHTAGACRLGKVAYKIAGKNIKKVDFLLHGSFGKTYKGHGTDKALLGGVLGFDPDDERIKHSFELAKEKGIQFRFIEENLGEVHSNTVKIIMEDVSNKKIEIMGSSIGGGAIKVIEINGLEVEFTGEYPTLIISHVDKPGVTANVTAILAKYQINIAFMRVYRYSKGENAFMIIETDNEITNNIIDQVKTVRDISNAYLINLK